MIECVLISKSAMAYEEDDNRSLRNRRKPFDNMIAERKPFVSLVAAFIIISVLMLVLDTEWWRGYQFDQDYAKFPKDGRSIFHFEVDRVCRNGHCCLVVDIVDMEKNTAKRAMLFGGEVEESDFESEVPLIVPSMTTVHDSDTRLWRVNHSHLLNEYVAAMALMPFVVGACGEQESEQEERLTFLVVGLGGASLDMFWHSRFPWFNITVCESDYYVIEMAAKWFGAVDDSTRLTVHGDGLELIRRFAKQSIKFTVLVVDACDSGDRMPCPSAKFLLPESLAVIKSSLRPMGVFVLNVLPLVEEEKVLTQVQARLLSVFPVCVQTRMAKQMNTIFTCLPYAIQPDGLADTVALWNSRLTELATEVGVHPLLTGVRVNNVSSRT